MVGKFLIDGEDAFVLYGVFVKQGGFNGILSFPAFKKLDENEWAEEDGSEVDTSDAVLDKHTFDISFNCTDYWKLLNFVSLISDGSYHEYEFKEAGCKKRMRLTDNPNKKIYRNMESITLSFSEDEPMSGYEYAAPVLDGGVPVQEGYEFDGVPTSNYGIYFVEGTLDEILKAPTVKQNLSVNIKKNPGIIYDGSEVFFKKKEVSLKCWMRCNSPETMYRNLCALVHDLSKKTLRTDEDGYKYEDALRSLYIDSIVEEYPCHYGGLNVTKYELLSGGRAWVEFDLKLVFTSFRVNGLEILLATEADELVITEDNEYYIDLS